MGGDPKVSSLKPGFMPCMNFLRGCNNILSALELSCVLEDPEM